MKLYHWVCDSFHYLTVAGSLESARAVLTKHIQACPDAGEPWHIEAITHEEPLFVHPPEYPVVLWPH